MPIPGNMGRDNSFMSPEAPPADTMHGDLSGIESRDLDRLSDRIEDQEWRLDNLYYIINEEGKRVLFRMRNVQRKLFRGRWWRNIIVKARQLGYTSFIDIFGLDLAIFNRNVRGGIVAHTRQDAQIIFRDKIKYAYENLPAQVRNRVQARKCDAGELLLANNSSIRVGTGFRSATAQFLHVSEYAKICAKYPQKAKEILTGSIPAVHKGGFVFIEGTAEGRSGSFFDIAEDSRKFAGTHRPLTELSFKFWFTPWWVDPKYTLPPSGIVIPARLRTYFSDLEKRHRITLSKPQQAWYATVERIYGEDMLREYPSTPDEAFKSSVHGAYYKAQLYKAYQDGRVTDLPIEKGYKIHTAWDIGHGDSTAIWFYQVIGNWIHVVDYYENCGEPLGHYVDVLCEKAYDYGNFYGPHDLLAHDWGTGHTAAETALTDYGIAFLVAPNISLSDGIERTRTLLSRCVFDEERCSRDLGKQPVGLTSLESYHHEWDEDNGMWKSTPFHDWASHGADSFRYLALTVGQEGAGLTVANSVDRWVAR